MSKKLLSRATGRTRALIGIGIALSFLFGTQAAHAAFPGANGKIVFDRDGAPPKGDESDQIYTINPDGTGTTDLSNNSVLDEDGRWSADGLKIAYDSFGQNNQIFFMKSDGSSQTNLTNNAANSDDDPAWSPDGTKLVYTHFNGSTNHSELWLMNADGSNQHVLFTPDPGSFDDFGNWSPDGTQIAFSRFTPSTGNSQIYVVNADGSGTPQNVSNDPDFDEIPNWSPDGTKLAFDKYPDQGGAPEIWVMNKDGANPHLVTSSTTANDTNAAWSPDGTQIAYASEARQTGSPSRGFQTRQQQIWVVNADGSNDHAVSSPSTGFDDYAPDWQPVGAPASAATLPSGCTATGSVVVHAGDATGFKSALNVHYKLDGGAEQVAAADGAGNVTIAVPNGTHTVEYWGGDAAGYQEAAHHTGSVTVDTVTHCTPAPPKVAVAGVRRACVSKAFHVRVHITSAGTPKSVQVFLGKKRVLTTTKTSFSLRINPKKLGHRTRLRIVTTDASGRVTTTSRTIARCAVAKPRRHVAPRFTG